ncbi:P21 prophage-derived terminase small subunit [Orchesella cincta]|uniref:P21 prophage-derived terminase small subunit n=1 Tax=Orchesella cincta TaxID=48709 RepID=A0A1D2M8A2_ORCCI|nr:P21 prophage-derived terminase small subunit [Orchesella cincta]
MEKCELVFYIILVSMTQLQLTLPQAFLQSGAFYHIKNALDHSYLRIDTLGSPCRNLGSVGTSSSLDTNSAAYRWKYIVLFENVTFLDVEWTEQKIQLNEISRAASQSHCYPLYRRFNITEVQVNLYKLQNIEDGNSTEAKLRGPLVTRCGANNGNS